MGKKKVAPASGVQLISRFFAKEQGAASRHRQRSSRTSGPQYATEAASLTTPLLALREEAEASGGGWWWPRRHSEQPSDGVGCKLSASRHVDDQQQQRDAGRARRRRLVFVVVLVVVLSPTASSSSQRCLRRRPWRRSPSGDWVLSQDFAHTRDSYTVAEIETRRDQQQHLVLPRRPPHYPPLPLRLRVFESTGKYTPGSSAAAAHPGTLLMIEVGYKYKFFAEDATAAAAAGHRGPPPHSRVGADGGGAGVQLNGTCGGYAISPTLNMMHQHDASLAQQLVEADKSGVVKQTDTAVKLILQVPTLSVGDALLLHRCSAAFLLSSSAQSGGGTHSVRQGHLARARGGIHKRHSPRRRHPRAARPSSSFSAVPTVAVVVAGDFHFFEKGRSERRQTSVKATATAAMMVTRTKPTTGTTTMLPRRRRTMTSKEA